MKFFYFIVFAVLLFYAGWLAGSLVHHDPTPEQCLSVCVEEFEKLAG